MIKKSIIATSLLSAAVILSVTFMPIADICTGESMDSQEKVYISIGSEKILSSDLSTLIEMYYSEIMPDSSLTATEIYQIALLETRSGITQPDVSLRAGVTTSHPINGGERIYLSSLTLGVIVGGGSVAAALLTAGLSAAVVAIAAAAFAASGIVIGEYLNTGIVFDFIYYMNVYLPWFKVMVPIHPRIENVHKQ